jgi:two-component system chemotaxis response regulator CheB
MPSPDVVVIGGSAGGMKALNGILQTFQQVGNCIIVVVLHRPPQESPLIEVLQTYTRLPVHEPDASPWPCPVGGLTVAPAGYHLLVGNGRTPLRVPATAVSLYQTDSTVRAHLVLDGPVAYSRPSIDVTFTSAGQLVNSVTAVLLSCANDDGAAGCAAVKAAGGRVVLQDPASCEARAAVTAAMRRVKPDYVGDPTEIGRWLSRRSGRN